MKPPKGKLIFIGSIYKHVWMYSRYDFVTATHSHVPSLKITAGVLDLCAIHNLAIVYTVYGKITESTRYLH